jgi:thiol:disulfide interchange protein
MTRNPHLVRSRRRYGAALGLLLSALLPTEAAAQLPPQDFDPEKGDVRLAADRTAYDPGAVAEIAVLITIEPGWHTNSHVPSYEGLIGLDVVFEAPTGWPVPSEPVYPPGEMKSFSFTPEPISVYEAEVVIRGSVEVPAGAIDGTYPLRATVTYQACDDKMCLPPVTTESTLGLTVGAGGVASEDWLMVSAGRSPSASPGAISTTPTQGGRRGVLWFVLIGLLGGLILNAMPCVLPILSLKVFGLVKSAEGGRRSVAIGGVGTAAGILISFWLLAAAAIIARSAGAGVGWGIQFQEPIFVASLSIVILLFALNLWGLFEIRLPRFAGQAAAAAPSEGLAGHLATGFFATLMATPCSAPFLGTALGFALTQSAATTVGMFTAIGLGMASPYLLLAAFPAAARVLPRPGRWMVTFRTVMGFLLAGAAIWLLYVLSGLISPERLAFFEGALLAIALVVWLRARRAESAGGVTRATAFVAVAGLCVAAVALAAEGDPTPRTLGVAPEHRLIDWVEFDRARAEEAAVGGRYVFVDVTADWCVTCKVNERLFLETREVADAFERHDVLAMRADWTRRDDSIARYLADFGRYGIPFYVMYRPGREPHVFSELLSKSAIIDLLEDG